jgi:hypothetical protein
MANAIIKLGGAALFLSLLCGCAPPPTAGQMTWSHCSPGSHDVANLDAQDPRRAYWCKSDIDGYLGEEKSGHLPAYPAN